MNSIRKKITVCLMATVVAALVLVGVTSIALNYRSTVATVDQMMSETAVLAAERIEQELAAYRNVAIDAGCIGRMGFHARLPAGQHYQCGRLQHFRRAGLFRP